MQKKALCGLTTVTINAFRTSLPDEGKFPSQEGKERLLGVLRPNTSKRARPYVLLVFGSEHGRRLEERTGEDHAPNRRRA